MSMSVKSTIIAKKDCSQKPSRYICKKSRCLKSIVSNSVIKCNEIMNVTDSVSTNVANTISTNITSAVPVNSKDKKVGCEKIIALSTLFH